MPIKNLVLIPTHLEYLRLKDQVAAFQSSDVHVAICGFGPVAAATRASMLIAEFTPSHVWNLGIAGSLRSAAAVGEAYSFSSVSMHGIGAGEGTSHLSAQEMDWHFWVGDTDEKLNQEAVIGSQLLIGGKGSAGLLTVCAASASEKETQHRRKKFPSAIAEDMESFSVAMACKLADVPLVVIRGISNVAGNRNFESWEVDKALAAVAELANELLEA